MQQGGTVRENQWGVLSGSVSKGTKELHKDLYLENIFLVIYFKVFLL